jgi:electron-transferring-flavoprotein dehydrogenase
VKDSVIEKDLWQSRNMRQPLSKGLIFGGIMGSAMVATKGAFPGGHWKNEARCGRPGRDRQGRNALSEARQQVHLRQAQLGLPVGSATRDDAPNHIRIQERVPKEIAQTWVSMCPAQVYEIPEEQLESGADTVDVHVTPSNCVQCGAITAKGGRLTLPEGRRRPAVSGDLVAARRVRA